MEEKTLVTGKVNAKKFLIVSLIVVGVIFALSMVLCFIIADSSYDSWMDYGVGAYFAEYYLPWIGVATAILAALAVGAFFLVKQNEMQVTEKRICVKGFFGKCFVLPNDAITAVGYVPLFGGVLVSTPSGKAAMLLLDNAKEVYEALLEQMLKRQK